MGAIHGRVTARVTAPYVPSSHESRPTLVPSSHKSRPPCTNGRVTARAPLGIRTLALAGPLQPAPRPSLSGNTPTLARADQRRSRLARRRTRARQRADPPASKAARAGRVGRSTSSGRNSAETCRRRPHCGRPTQSCCSATETAPAAWRQDPGHANHPMMMIGPGTESFLPAGSARSGGAGARLT